MKRTGHWILDGIEPIEVDLMTWARWYGDADRHIAFDHLEPWRVSTVFLGLDHNFGGEGPPLLFETMVFGEGWGDLWCERTSTYEQAITIHEIGRLEATELSLKTDEAVRLVLERARM